MSVGNVLGSNMLNILFVVGLVAMIQPMEVDRESITHHIPVMILFSLLLWPLARSKYLLSKPNGVILLIGFLAYLTWLILPHIN